MSPGGVIFIMCLIAVAVIWGYTQHRNAENKKAAWNYYQWCLANLRHDHNARSQVVNAGRIWYGLLRDGTVTMYDEMAISNDIKQAGG